MGRGGVVGDSGYEGNGGRGVDPDAIAGSDKGARLGS